VWTTLFARTEGWQARAYGRVEPKRVLEHRYDAPDRNHEYKTNDPVDDKLTPFLLTFFISRTDDEILNDTPQENDERDCKDERDEILIEKRYDSLQEITKRTTTASSTAC
jgi:hypothetical protein